MKINSADDKGRENHEDYAKDIGATVIKKAHQVVEENITPVHTPNSSNKSPRGTGQGRG